MTLRVAGNSRTGPHRTDPWTHTLSLTILQRPSLFWGCLFLGGTMHRALSFGSSLGIWDDIGQRGKNQLSAGHRFNLCDCLLYSVVQSSSIAAKQAKQDVRAPGDELKEIVPQHHHATPIGETQMTRLPRPGEGTRLPNALGHSFHNGAN